MIFKSLHCAVYARSERIATGHAKNSARTVVAGIPSYDMNGSVNGMLPAGGSSGRRKRQTMRRMIMTMSARAVRRSANGYKKSEMNPNNAAE